VPGFLRACSLRLWHGPAEAGRRGPGGADSARENPPDAAEFLVRERLATTGFRLRPTSPPCWRAASACPGTASPNWAAPATAATAAWSGGP
jgi:hypothetical protein